MKDRLFEEHCTFSTVSLRPFKGSSLSQSVYNEGHLTCRTQHLLSYISTSIQRIFMKLHIQHSGTTCYKPYKSSHDWSIMKVTLLEEQSTFSAVPLLPFKGSLWNSISSTKPPVLQHLWVWLWLVFNERNFSCRIKYLLGCISSSIQGIFWKLHIQLPAPTAYNTHTFCCSRSKIRALYI